jgi:hypothetical protein
VDVRFQLAVGYTGLLIALPYLVLWALRAKANLFLVGLLGVGAIPIAIGQILSLYSSAFYKANATDINGAILLSSLFLPHLQNWFLFQPHFTERPRILVFALSFAAGGGSMALGTVLLTLMESVFRPTHFHNLLALGLLSSCSAFVMVFVPLLRMLPPLPDVSIKVRNRVFGQGIMAMLSVLSLSALVVFLTYTIIAVVSNAKQSFFGGQGLSQFVVLVLSSVCLGITGDRIASTLQRAKNSS